ncbi:MAG: COX15/CtaA family protein [Phycisphaerales bacterium]|jgi:cytochrome c oxidase assembly protein subunit 15|nr:COX15/CtaA family protein [Phycisphaerales bacterium]
MTSNAAAASSRVLTANRPPIWGEALTFGLGGAIAVWIAAFVTHLPGLGLPAPVQGLSLALALAIVMVLAGQRARSARAWVVGLWAGLVCAAANCLIFTSLLGDLKGQGLSGETPVLIAVLFIWCGLTGAAAAALGGRAPLPAHRTRWLASLAAVAAAGVLPMLLIGGLVTSTESGMAVPDWPTSFGFNMFQLPASQFTQERVFLEHSHRLFGTLVGLTFIALFVSALVSRASVRECVWAGVLLVLVSAQGVAGGLRVAENSAYLGALHGVLGQVFFALAVGYAARLSPVWASREAGPVPGKKASMGVLHATILQLALGALFRHTGSTHPLWAHVGFSLVVVIFALAAGFAMAKDPGEGPDAKVRRKIGAGLVAIVTLQWLLGWGALTGAMMGRGRGAIPLHDQLADAPSVPVWEVLATTSHQFTGAVLLAMAALAVAWTRPRKDAAR